MQSLLTIMLLECLLDFVFNFRKSFYKFNLALEENNLSNKKILILFFLYGIYSGELFIVPFGTTAKLKHVNLINLILNSLQYLKLNRNI